MWPLDSRRNPEMHSMSVVLPAPLGPMSPTISPSRTSRSTVSRAASPPKRTVTPRQSSTGAESVRSETIDEAGRDHLVLVVALRLEHRHPLGPVHQVLAADERDGPRDQIAVVVVGLERVTEALAGQVGAGSEQRTLQEVDDLVTVRTA